MTYGKKKRVFLLQFFRKQTQIDLLKCCFLYTNTFVYRNYITFMITQCSYCCTLSKPNVFQSPSVELVKTTKITYSQSWSVKAKTKQIIIDNKYISFIYNHLQPKYIFINSRIYLHLKIFKEFLHTFLFLKSYPFVVLHIEKKICLNYFSVTLPLMQLRPYPLGIMI